MKNQSFEELLNEEIVKQFNQDMLELCENYDNDEFYEEVMNIEKILKMEGF